jgi:ubiquinone biosynthesis protein UbiJ
VPPARQAAPRVRLGQRTEDGIAPTMFALIEHAVGRRPGAIAAMRGRVELRFHEQIDPVRMRFDGDEVLVEDGHWDRADLVVSGRLPHIVQITTAPNVGGVPNPVRAGGRAALGRIASGRVRVEGDRTLGRRLLSLLAL